MFLFKTGKKAQRQRIPYTVTHSIRNEMKKKKSHQPKIPHTLQSRLF